MTESKGWNWSIVSDNYWKIPSIDSYYLLNRWINQNKKNILDLGCGVGRHSILFALNNFYVYSFDISEVGIGETKKWSEELNLSNIDFKVGDMLSLPYEDNSIDSIICYNVISHSDTIGVVNAIQEIKRVLKHDGEAFITLCSKETWGYKQNWPKIDENTLLKMEEGPEYKVPHFYADYNLVKELFKDFEIIDIRHIQDYFISNNKECSSYHFHILIKKK